MEALSPDVCATCGSTETVHGDCLNCNSPLAARSSGPARPLSYTLNETHTDDHGNGWGTSPSRQTVDDVVVALGGRLPAQVVTEHLAELPASYVTQMPAEVIGDHIALIAEAKGNTAVTHSNRDGVDQITLVAADRPGILSAVSGALAMHGVSILRGAIHTKSTGQAIDVLTVTRTELAEAPWDTICSQVARTVDGDVAVEESWLTRDVVRPRGARVPTSVYVDNDSSSQFTKVEVNASDRVGVLFAIARAIASLGLDIHLAQVDTYGTTTVDTFYLRHADGTRVESASDVAALRREISGAIDRLS